MNNSGTLARKFSIFSAGVVERGPGHSCTSSAWFTLMACPSGCAVAAVSDRHIEKNKESFDLKWVAVDSAVTEKGLSFCMV